MSQLPYIGTTTNENHCQRIQRSVAYAGFVTGGGQTIEGQRPESRREAPRGGVWGGAPPLLCMGIWGLCPPKIFENSYENLCTMVHLAKANQVNITS
jgi:hypothetical protein